jgi:NTP pyrophosphatase (non-canonical NTP hydrolase)
MIDLKTLQNLIIDWAKERDLLKKENADKQRLRLLEEVGETARAILKNNIVEIKDGIGDIFVILTILAKQESEIFEIKSEINKNIDYTIVELLNSIVYFEYNNTYSVLTRICTQLNLNLEECCNLAWNQIKNRKGETIDGTFIKFEK